MSDRVERTARVAAPAVLALFVVIGVALSSQPLPVALAVGAVSVGASVVLSVLMVSGWPVVGGLAVAAAGIVVICNQDPANLGWFALCVLVAWAALRAPTEAAVSFAVVVVLAVVAQWLVVSDEPGWGAWIAGTAFTTVACLLARRQVVLVEQLRAAQAGLADRARTEERARIAREMHDVIGHALTVSLLHVTGARLALDETPAEARAALDEAERLTRRSLAEVRGAVGLMREDGTGTSAPLPAAGDIEDLVESFRRAGAVVAYDVTGDPASLTATEGLTVYRILQEAITNAVRHSPGMRVTVRVEVARGRALVVVDSPGAPGSSAHGTGVTGMRERAEALGGRLSAGPWRAGWRVEAVLPR